MIDDGGLSPETVGLILVGGKLWEILSYAIVFGLYIAIKCQVKRQVRSLCLAVDLVFCQLLIILWLFHSDHTHTHTPD